MFIRLGLFHSLLLCILLISACNSNLKLTSSAFEKKPNTEQTLRSSILKEAEKYKGIKYIYGGKDPKGFDCSGFTYYVFSKFDIKLSGSSAYQSKEGLEISPSSAKAGDLLFFGRNGKNGKIQHVGLVYANNSEGLFMIHSSSSRGIVIDNVSTSSYWKPRLLYARKVVHLRNPG